MDFPRLGIDGAGGAGLLAARGLGVRISLALAHAGADVALGLRDSKAVRRISAEIRAMGARGRWRCKWI